MNYVFSRSVSFLLKKFSAFNEKNVINQKLF